MQDLKTDRASCVFLIILEGDLVQTPEHLGVSYLAAVLRRSGHRCGLIDVPPGKATDVITAHVAALEPHFVGFSLTTVNLDRVTELGRILRALLGPKVHICAGGPVATSMAERLLQSPSWAFLDSVVRGEAEGVIDQLVTSVLNDRPIQSIPGVAVRDHLQSIAPPAVVDDLDVLPWPVRDQLEAHRGRFPYVRLSTSRGCTSHCTFCNAPHARNRFAGQKVWRGRSPQDVVDEIEFLNSRYGVDTFDFVDSTYEDPDGRTGKRRVQQITELILQRGLRIYYNICVQAKNWTERDTALVHLMYRSGLEKVLIGVESGSDRTLELFQKRSTSADNRRAIRLFRQLGVYVACGFIMFQPFADWMEIEENAEFLLENMGHNLRRFCVRLELYPGAQIVQQLSADNLLEPDYWQTLNPYAYRYVEPAIGQMARAMNSLFGEQYLWQGRIAREPSVFAFETFDITVHTYLSRLLRMLSDESGACAVIDEYARMIDAEKDELRSFNGAVFQEAMTCAKRRYEIPPNLAETVETRYAEAIDRIKSVQLRLGMKLRRQGIRPLTIKS